MPLRSILNDQTDERLRKKAEEVDRIDDEIKDLLKDMSETMYYAKGSGLAAPQLGILLRIAVVDDAGDPLYLINPQIVRESGRQLEMEGCLSVPGITGYVPRPDFVVVKALNEKGKSVQIKASGYLSRVICHEIDHLDGILFIDKMIPEKKNQNEDPET